MAFPMFNPQNLPELANLVAGIQPQLCAAFGPFMEHLQQEMAGKKDGFYKAFNVKGYDPKDINIEVKDGYLHIKGDHKSTSEDGEEFKAKSFEQRIKLDDNLDLEKISSKLVADGTVLKIEAPFIPKPEEEKPSTSGIQIPIHRG